MAENLDKKRKTIGFLIDNSEDQYHEGLLTGVTDAAEKFDANLLCFVGGTLNAANKYDVKRNVIYDLVNDDLVDGLIIQAETIGIFTDKETIVRFCRRYESVPIITISSPIENFPSLRIDNETGFRELLHHLLERHNNRKFIFISGPENNHDAVSRMKVFLETMKGYNITEDSVYIASGDFTFISGKRIINGMTTDEIKKYDAIVAANDEMALGAINALKNRDIKVPWDIGVVGFDNIKNCKYSIPLLTTVKQSIFDTGFLAVKNLLSMISGKRVDKEIILPSGLLARESCGCFYTNSPAVEPPPPVASPTFAETTAEDFTDRFLPIFFQDVNHISGSGYKESFSGEIKELIAILFHAIKENDQGKFLSAWNAFLCKTLWEDESISICSSLLTRLKRDLLPMVSGGDLFLQTEKLLQHVSILLEKKYNQLEKQNYQLMQHKTMVLSYIREQLLITQDLESFYNLLADQLPELGISSCYFSVFADGGNELNARLVMGYNKNGRISGKETFFPAGRLIPETENDQRYTRLIEPITFAKIEVGFFVLAPETGDWSIYGELRRLISHSMENIELFQEIQTQRNNLKEQQKKLISNLKTIRKAMSGFIETLAITVETRDPSTAGHQRRVAELSQAIAREMHLPEKHVEAVFLAGMVHDLGKIYIPVEILNKPVDLHEIEFDLIKTHPEIAYDILNSIDFPWPIAEIVLQHHERINGTGYPLKLKKEAICVEARIICVADVVDAMAFDRPYRAAPGIEAAVLELEKNSGILYDNEIVRICLSLFREKGYMLE